MNYLFESISLRVTDNDFWVIDQELIPWKEEWIRIESTDHLIGVIQKLKIRGAPMIGIVAALQLARETTDFESKAARLRAARPTAVNLMHAVDRMLECARVSKMDSAALKNEALKILREDEAICLKIAQHGLEQMNGPKRILTVCNTGTLATAGIGTAFGIARHAHSMGMLNHLWITETRPLLQGGRLTVWEVEKCKLPHTLLTDNMAAYLMSKNMVDLVIAGADRIAANGDTANKIGTYSLAVLARAHGIPFWIAAPSTTFDPNCPTGAQIQVEQRAQKEVRGVHTVTGTIAWASETTAVWNPAFDVTPARFISGWISENGFFSRAGEAR